jgi:hypothetical protein
MFTPDRIAQLDEALIKKDSSHYVSPIMRRQGCFSEDKILTHDIEELKYSTDELLKTKEIVLGYGTSQPLIKESIDIGHSADDTASTHSVPNYTLVQKYNPANASGTIDTIQIFCSISLTTNTLVATFYIESGSNLSTRDYCNLGAVTQGSVQTFTAPDDFTALDVETDDMIGITWDTNGQLDRNTSDAPGYFYINTAQIPCSDVTFGSLNGWHSLYGTGSEAGGGWSNIAKVGGVTAASMAKINSVAVADIAKLNGVAV